MAEKLNIYDIEGKVTGQVTLDTIPAGFEPDANLISRSLKRQLNNARHPIASTKGRAEVRGGGKKIYRQKGTGRARHGGSRANLFKGGGVTFGPTPEKNYKTSMNRKERKAALRHAVWSKIIGGDVLLLGEISLETPSTQKADQFFKAVEKEGKCLLLVPGDAEFDVLRKSFRNLPFVTILPPERLNTFDLLNNHTVLAQESAFETVRNTWGI